MMRPKGALSFRVSYPACGRASTECIERLCALFLCTDMVSATIHAALSLQDREQKQPIVK